MSVKLDKLILANVLECHTGLVVDCLGYGVFDEADILHLWHVDGKTEKREIKHWYSVTDYLAQLLIKADAPVLLNEYGAWWGRTSDDPLTDPDWPDLATLVAAL